MYPFQNWEFVAAHPNRAIIRGPYIYIYGQCLGPTGNPAGPERLLAHNLLPDYAQIAVREGNTIQLQCHSNYSDGSRVPYTIIADTLPHDDDDPNWV